MSLGFAYLFLWTFSKTTFKSNLTKLKELNNYKIVSLKWNIIIFLFVVFCTTLAIYKHPFYYFVLYWDETVDKLSKHRPNFPFEDNVKNAVILTISLFFDLWLSIFVPISVIYIMAIFIHFIREFKYLNKELTALIESTAIYKSSEFFSKWKKTHAQTSLVMSYFNSNMKLYINNIISIGCIGIMAVLYNTTVSCDSVGDAVIWISKYGIPLFGVMLPSISVNNQVMTFEIYCLCLCLKQECLSALCHAIFKVEEVIVVIA